MDKRISVLSIMQKYLPILRKINGWTTEDLGKRVGVTKQTIDNVSNYFVISIKVIERSECKFRFKDSTI